MSSVKFVTAGAVAAAAVCIHIGAFATQPSARGNASVNASSAVGGQFTVGRGGSSLSFAQSTQSASARISASRQYTPGFGNVSAAIGGETQTRHTGKAYNVSSGSGRGGASSLGSTDASVSGRAAIAGVTRGWNGGHAGTSTQHEIRARTNQGSYVLGEAQSGFDTRLDYARSRGAVGVTSSATGYAGGTNAYGALAGMNAAGLADIRSSGSFRARADLGASTATSAP